MKKFITSFLLLTFFVGFMPAAFATTVWADDSINELIIKQYDANALRDEHMPDLPVGYKNENNSSAIIPAVQVQPITQVKTSTKNLKSDNYVFLKKGKKFKLRLEQAIDDSSYVGAKVQFVSLYPESNKYITIPAGTKFIGVVEDAHMPQISSNGGLLVIKINQLVYKGKTYPIEAKVIKVGEKRIFQNNIKGKHTYWKNVSKVTKPGRKFYDKSWNITKDFAQDGLEVILTPITFVGGAAVLAATTISSPVIAFFSKGERLFIKKGTHFQIKLTEDAAINL